MVSQVGYDGYADQYADIAESDERAFFGREEWRVGIEVARMGVHVLEIPRSIKGQKVPEPSLLVRPCESGCRPFLTVERS